MITAKLEDNLFQG